MASLRQIWNKRNVSSPPFVTTLYCTKRDSYAACVLFNAVISIDYCSKKLSMFKCLTVEEWVLRRLIRRYNNSFRYEKILHGLKMIQKCLQRITEMNTMKMLETIMQDLPNRKEKNSGRYVYFHIPHRPSMEYFLLRFLGCCVLLSQTIDYCVSTYILASGPLMCGHFVAVMLVFMALVSRVRALCLVMLKELAICYRDIYKLATTMKPPKINWLPEGVEMPADLEVYLTEQGYTRSQHVIADKNKEMNLSILLSNFENVKSDPMLIDLQEALGLGEHVQLLTENSEDLLSCSVAEEGIPTRGSERVKIDAGNLTAEQGKAVSDSKCVDITTERRGHSGKKRQKQGIEEPASNTFCKMFDDDLGEPITKQAGIRSRQKKVQVGDKQASPSAAQESKSAAQESKSAAQKSKSAAQKSKSAAWKRKSAAQESVLEETTVVPCMRQSRKNKFLCFQGKEMQRVFFRRLNTRDGLENFMNSLKESPQIVRWDKIRMNLSKSKRMVFCHICQTYLNDLGQYEHHDKKARRKIIDKASHALFSKIKLCVTKYCKKRTEEVISERAELEARNVT